MPDERRDNPDEVQEEGVCICFSGGGYRAMIFHTGVLWRLNELGALAQAARISSVSGGSIACGVLGLSWEKLLRSAFSSEVFRDQVVAPIRRLARRTIDVTAVIHGTLRPFTSISDVVIRTYRETLFADTTLQSLPDHPRFVFNATSVQTGALVRFSKPYLRDYRVGRVEHPKVSMAVAVAASSAFPPFLSPVELDFRAGEVIADPGSDLHQEPYLRRWILTDGGVYDNLGLETAFKRYRTLLVSDAGAKIVPKVRPLRDWVGHSRRVMDLVDNQVRSLRKRQLLDALRSCDPVHGRTGAYWSIRSDMAAFGLPSALDAPFGRTSELAATATRLRRMPEQLQERLINWGYAVCDAAVRKHWMQRATVPASLPYPRTGI